MDTWKWNLCIWLIKWICSVCYRYKPQPMIWFRMKIWQIWHRETPIKLFNDTVDAKHFFFFEAFIKLICAHKPKSLRLHEQKFQFYSDINTILFSFLFHVILSDSNSVRNSAFTFDMKTHFYYHRFFSGALNFLVL